MVVLPYNDRYLLSSEYLQQFAIEALRKQPNLDGRIVKRRIKVLGNEGSTYQDPCIQRLRYIVPNFLPSPSISSAIAVRVLATSTGEKLSTTVALPSGNG